MNTDQSKTTHDDGLPSWFPRLEIPANGKWGTYHFEFTYQGLEFHYNRYKVCCTASAQQLVAAGVMRSEWQAPSTSTSWCVMDVDDEPVLRIGGRGVPRGQFIAFRREQYGLLLMQMPLTNAQRKAIEATEPEGEAEEPRPQQAAEPPAKMTEEIYYWFRRGEIRGALTRLEDGLAPDRGFRFTAASEVRILRLMSELDRAYIEANVTRVVPAYQQEGNVITFPKRAATR